MSGDIGWPFVRDLYDPNEWEMEKGREVISETGRNDNSNHNDQRIDI